MLKGSFMEPGVAAYTCHPGTWRVAAGEFRVQEYLWLGIEFKASLNYLKHCVSKPGKNEKVVVVGLGGGQVKW